MLAQAMTRQSKILLALLGIGAVGTVAVVVYNKNKAALAAAPPATPIKTSGPAAFLLVPPPPPPQYAVQPQYGLAPNQTVNVPLQGAGTVVTIGLGTGPTGVNVSSDSSVTSWTMNANVLQLTMSGQAGSVTVSWNDVLGLETGTVTTS